MLAGYRDYFSSQGRISSFEAPSRPRFLPKRKRDFSTEILKRTKILRVGFALHSVGIDKSSPRVQLSSDFAGAGPNPLKSHPTSVETMPC